MATIAEVLAQAVQYQRAGQLDQAEQLYRQILQVDLSQAEAWYRLGSVQQARGRLAEALHSHQQALTLRPNYAEPHNDLGIVLAMSGRLDEAVARFREATRLAPTFADAFNNLGIVFGMQGHAEAALVSFQKALTLRPDYVEAWTNQGKLLLDVGRATEAARCYQQALAFRPSSAEAYQGLGIAQRSQGQWAEAAASFRQAVQLRPDYADAHVNLGLTLADLGQRAEAIDCHRRALQLKPDHAEAHHGLGNAYRDLGRLEEAAASFQQAIRCKPQFAAAYSSLGAVLTDLGNPAEAVSCLEQALRLKPDSANTYLNLGVAHAEQRRWNEALACYDQALRLQPNQIEAHWNRALLWLLTGNFAQGWPEFEWRLQFPRLGLKRDFAQPRWDGSDLKGRTLLLHAEGGFGDALQFVRYAPLAAQRGGRVVLECQPELIALLRGVASVAQVVGRGQPLPPFDVHCPLQSLPLAFGTTLQTIPAAGPYVTADAERVAAWRSRLAAGEAAFRVGLVWSGRPKNLRKHNPNLSLAEFAPLAEVKGTVFYSLQKGEGASQAHNPPRGMTLIDPTADLVDFADTAALIACLDLVISVDTSVVHLAGALGKPVWVLLPALPDFRWLLDREDSPWYPSMRLFRQAERGDRGEIMRRIAEEKLPRFIVSRSPGQTSAKR